MFTNGFVRHWTIDKFLKSFDIKNKASFIEIMTAKLKNIHDNNKKSKKLLSNFIKF